jgi:hypothetical protein
MPRDPYIREKFTRERSAARKLAAEYFARYPKVRYQTEVESWRLLQSANIEFTIKRLREPIGTPGWCAKHPLAGPAPSTTGTSRWRTPGVDLPKSKHWFSGGAYWFARRVKSANV